MVSDTLPKPNGVVNGLPGLRPEPLRPSNFADANIADIVEQLTLEEAIALTAGVGNWYTAAIPRLGIPALKVSDGPNGIRGTRFFMGTPAKCIPSATALAATFDVELVGEVAEKLLAPETKLKAANLLLAPTCNIQRSPLGGRSFESFSEDPLLSGLMAASFISNVQKGGVGCCIKHFAANDQENDRLALDTIVSDRALREIYLYPFMLAQKYAQPWSYMTAYNRINGVHCSENTWLLKDVLREEWGHNGVIMSDWFGVYSLTESVNATLDLEMPGHGKFRTKDQMRRAVEARKLTARQVKVRAQKVLELVQKAAKGSAEVLDGDHVEKTRDSQEDVELMRKVACGAIVLLKNSNNLLPLNPQEHWIKRIAIIGPNAKAAVISGGGSASLKAKYVVTPYEGIVEALPIDVEVLYAEGCQAYQTLPLLDRMITTENGKRGWTGSFFSTDAFGNVEAEPLETHYLDETMVFINDAFPVSLTERWRFHARGYLPPREESYTFEFGLSVAGRAKLFVDGELVVDNWTTQTRGTSFFNQGTVEEKGSIFLEALKRHEVYIEFANDRPDGTFIFAGSGSGFRLGGREVYDEDEGIEKAVAIASEADVAIVVVGLNSDWETEGHDRTTLTLPLRTDELVHRIAMANSKTIVVTQSGSAIIMPWLDSVSSVVHAWYLGNETGHAIADVLFGKVNPSGKMSLTFPKKLEDVPSYLSFGSQNGQVRYAEDLFVGYRHYQAKNIEPLFPFGYGLSYTTFEYSDIVVGKPTTSDATFSSTVSVTITNSGHVVGTETVQLYISPPTCVPTPAPITGYLHPRLQLKAFAKVRNLQPRAHATIDLTLDKLSVSYWDDVIDHWVGETGEYKVWLGSSSEDLRICGVLKLEKTFEWRGL